MTVSATHGPYLVEIDVTKLGGIQSLSLPWGTAMRGEALSDEVYARFLSVVGERPSGRFSTLNVAAALTAVGTSGASIATKNVTFYAQKRIDAATRATGSNHRKFACTNGLIVPMSLSCDYGGDAVVEYLVMPRSTDGVTHPFAITDSVALPEGITDAERFTLPPADSIDVGGVALDHLRGIDIDFGIELVAEAADNEIFDTMVWIQSISPVITLRGVDVGWVDEAESGSIVPVSGGLVCTHANTNIYLQKRADTGILMAVGTAEHIKFTAAGLAVPDSVFDGASGASGETSIRIRCNYDGTNSPLTVDGAIAIT